ncbi:FG-GAP-like repeat-containing protein [Plantactinospora sp. CA-290183]|uniref:FG-GAP-like repeat-containing protein n=1 Tax=Plantactinospora sp. CA-290183 TaxID=3240006 RepID=UPI003D8AA5F3
MWNRRIIALAVTVGIATLGAAAPAAQAGWQDEPIIADVNGDGLADRNTLGFLPGPGQCAVLVELGRPGGGYGPVQSYPYLSAPYCPDMGVGLNLDSDAPDELVVAWFAGRPPSVASDLLALDSFQVSAGFDTIFQPSFIGTADFDGDGRLDVYEWTDQGDGFATYLNTGTGALVAGPVHYCSGRPDYRLADFDADGAMDVTIAYAEGCAGHFAGVVVVLDDGTVLDLHADPDGDDHWSVEVAEVNNDGILDVLTHSDVTGADTVFLGTGDGRFVRAPVAVRDYPTVPGAKSSGIQVKANDYATSRARVTILVPPTHGTVRVTTNGTVVYTPHRQHGGTDRFVYRLSEGARSSNATVSLRIRD